MLMVLLFLAFLATKNLTNQPHWSRSHFFFSPEIALRHQGELNRFILKAVIIIFPGCKIVGIENNQVRGCDMFFSLSSKQYRQNYTAVDGVWLYHVNDGEKFNWYLQYFVNGQVYTDGWTVSLAIFMISLCYLVHYDASFWLSLFVIMLVCELTCSI